MDSDESHLLSLGRVGKQKRVRFTYFLFTEASFQDICFSIGSIYGAQNLPMEPLHKVHVPFLTLQIFFLVVITSVVRIAELVAVNHNSFTSSLF